MKKYVVHLCIFVCFVMFCFVYKYSYGLTQRKYLCSQIEYSYYEVETDYYSATLRFGERESYFRRDGIRTQKKQYGVITVKLFGDISYATSIAARLNINDNVSLLILEQNPFDQSFMCDIEKVYNSDNILFYIDNIDFQYNQFMCVNNDFSTTYDNAIKFGFDKLKPFIDQNIDMVECYLTIQKYGETYVWYFYAVGKTEVKFVLFDDKLNVLAMS